MTLPSSNLKPRKEPEPSTRDLMAIREFISMAVHDLREPLRAIRVNAELVHRSPGSATVPDALKLIQDAVTRSETLIRDIADYCYAEIRKPRIEEVSMEDVLRETRAEMADELHAVNCTLTADPLPDVAGDFLELKDLLTILIKNACKFRGDEPLQVSISVEPDGSNWIFSVKDNGLGFSPQYAERIFRPFEKLYGKKFPGSGLGLTIAQIIAGHCGGSIWTESEPGQGAVFYFTLPAAP